MAINDLTDYLKDKSGTVSMMNFVDINGDFTVSDYYEIVISDKYKYRVDLLARDLLGDSRYYFLILMLNSINNLDSIEVGTTLKIPTTSFISKYYGRLQKEVI